MKYHQLTMHTNKPTHRVGRGIAAGQGKTAGRGTKGQNSRTGSSAGPASKAVQIRCCSAYQNCRALHRTGLSSVL